MEDMSHGRAVLFLFGWSLAAGVLAGCGRAGDPSSESAVAVAAVAPDGAGAAAGLLPGDLVVSFRGAGGAAGALPSGFAFAELEIEQVPRGPVELTVRRGGRELTIKLPPWEWQVTVEHRSPSPAGRAWAAFNRAEEEARDFELDAAIAAYGEALAGARAAGPPLFAALVLERRGTALANANDFPGAERDFEESLALRRKAAPASLSEAASLQTWGRFEADRSNPTAAEPLLAAARALRSKLAPDSLAHARTLNALGFTAWTKDDFDRALPLYQQGLALVRKVRPQSMDEARFLNNLGLVARSVGDLPAADAYFTGALALLQKLVPGGDALPRVYVNLGLNAIDRGDLERAEAYFRQALERLERLTPGSLAVSNAFISLGQVARDRGDFPTAVEHYRRALAIRRKLAPGSLDEAESLSHLAWIAREEGRLDEAEALYRRCLEIRRKEAPDSSEVGFSLATLGTVALRRQDIEEARRLGEEGLALFDKTAPGSLGASRALGFLADVEMEAGNWSAAAKHLDRALAVVRRVAPGSRREADLLLHRADMVRRSGRPAAEVEAASTQAIEVIEDLVERAGSHEDKASFRAQYAVAYHTLLRAKIALGRPAEAFQVLERSRARSLLALLAQRDIAWSADLTAAQRSKLSRLERDYERSQGELARLDPDRERPRLDALLADLARLRGERASLLAEIARASPRYATLKIPRPLDLAGARRHLDPGTLLLSYAVGIEETVLFAVAADPALPGGLQAVTLPIGHEALATEVELFRSLILRGREQPVPEAALLAQGRKLYDLLLAPAEPWIGRSRRLLLSADGPLHTLPFAALVRPGSPSSFLAEARPLHTVLSATLYAEVKRGRSEGRDSTGSVVAFADPRLPAPRPAPAVHRGSSPLGRYRQGLPSLPASREEGETLAALYGSRAMLWTGAAATEERAKRSGGARYLHFALHALLDPRSPLDSALTFSEPREKDADNGLLQAWEIFEGARFEVDLVTLSACETGLGKDAAGEGLIGLTRAFQYAGARSILASLWSVQDRSTAFLMERFYTRLRAGQTKDVALQGAQRDLLSGSRRAELAHPYHWAAFELIGDWR